MDANYKGIHKYLQRDGTLWQDVAQATVQVEIYSSLDRYFRDKNMPKLAEKMFPAFTVNDMPSEVIQVITSSECLPISFEESS